ncbi:endonuclease domain-containing protein [Modestobacter roseus]|uniref:endonuclease domain-containing protein n=1 Tax=Modestobacter roseus TaxID=1181884 RepID=UPI001412147F|nr:DUF559 domain-containing protein [Modestobacter roseus]
MAEGAVTRDQLDRGLYRRVVRGVYAPPGMPFDHELVARATALVMPPEAALAGRSAAAWWQGRTAGSRDPVRVVVPKTSAWRGPRGVLVHRTEVRAGEIVETDDGIRITSVERTVWDVAALERLRDAVACLDAMAFGGELPDEVLRRVQRTATHQWGSRRVRKALSLVDGRAQSPAESWVRVACHAAGLPEPVPQFVVVDGGAFLGKVDLAWPEAKLIVEYEGPHHFDPVKAQKDDARYAALRAAGWWVIRLANADLRDMDAVVDRIRTALALATPRPLGQ